MCGVHDTIKMATISKKMILRMSFCIVGSMRSLSVIFGTNPTDGGALWAVITTYRI